MVFQRFHLKKTELFPHWQLNDLPEASSRGIHEEAFSGFTGEQEGYADGAHLCRSFSTVIKKCYAEESTRE